MLLGITLIPTTAEVQPTKASNCTTQTEHRYLKITIYQCFLYLLFFFFLKIKSSAHYF